MKSKMEPTIKYYLVDEVSGKKILCKITCGTGKIFISFEGYGDCCSKDGYGEPVVIDYFDEKLKVLVYSDINQEDPTHRVDLEGALENKRKVNA